MCACSHGHLQLASVVVAAGGEINVTTRVSGYGITRILDIACSCLLVYIHTCILCPDLIYNADQTKCCLFAYTHYCFLSTFIKIICCTCVYAWGVDIILLCA